MCWEGSKTILITDLRPLACRGPNADREDCGAAAEGTAPRQGHLLLSHRRLGAHQPGAPAVFAPAAYEKAHCVSRLCSIDSHAVLPEACSEGTACLRLLQADCVCACRPTWCAWALLASRT